MQPNEAQTPTPEPVRSNVPMMFTGANPEHWMASVEAAGCWTVIDPASGFLMAVPKQTWLHWICGRERSDSPICWDCVEEKTVLTKQELRDIAFFEFLLNRVLSADDFERECAVGERTTGQRGTTSPPRGDR